MSVELILGGAGTLLGVANFIYWAWWSKREKIKLVNPAFCVWFMHRGAGKVSVGDKNVELENHSLMLAADCNIVMTSGDKEMEIKGVYLDIEEQPYEMLNQYFVVPRRLCLESGTWDEPIRTEILYPKKSIFLTNERIFPAREVFEDLCNEEKYPEQPERDDDYYYRPPDFLKRVLDKAHSNYKICFYRYDDKMISWRFPNKWWRNLGKKLWG